MPTKIFAKQNFTEIKIVEKKRFANINYCQKISLTEEKNLTKKFCQENFLLTKIIFLKRNFAQKNLQKNFLPPKDCFTENKIKKDLPK